MTVVDPLSAFLSKILLSCDSSLSAFRAVNDMSFGLSSLISASSNLTSSKKVFKATEG